MITALPKRAHAGCNGGIVVRIDMGCECGAHFTGSRWPGAASTTDGAGVLRFCACCHARMGWTFCRSKGKQWHASSSLRANYCCMTTTMMTLVMMMMMMMSLHRRRSSRPANKTTCHPKMYKLARRIVPGGPVFS